MMGFKKPAEYRAIILESIRKSGRNPIAWLDQQLQEAKGDSKSQRVIIAALKRLMKDLERDGRHRILKRRKPGRAKPAGAR